MAGFSGFQLGLIGCGTRGAAHLLSLQRARFAHVAAVADLYDGHLQRAREIVNDPNLFTTRDYRELLRRPGLDAVIVAVPDFATAPVFKAAVAAVRAVYCEAPFGASVAEGEAMLRAAQNAHALVQVGTGVPTARACQKAKQMVASGELGVIYQVEAERNLATSIGAWRAPYPPHASPATIDWNAFQATAGQKTAFSLPRFFRWRCYRDYGSGVAGDALMDSLTAVQWLLDPAPPRSVRAGGANVRWHDGRQTPDVFRAAFAFPGYECDVRCSMLTSAGGHKLRLCGSAASLELEDSRGNGFDVLRLRPELEREPYEEAVVSWPRSDRDFFLMEHGLNDAGTPMLEPWPSVGEETLLDRPAEVSRIDPEAQPGSLLDLHLNAFLMALAGRGESAEPPELGLAAARLAHAAEAAYRSEGSTGGAA